jgi:hypothetical protein
MPAGLAISAGVPGNRAARHTASGGGHSECTANDVYLSAIKKVMSAG